MNVVDYSWETEQIVGQYARELYETGKFSKINIKAEGRDGYTYITLFQDDEKKETNDADSRTK